MAENILAGFILIDDGLVRHLAHEAGILHSLRKQAEPPRQWTNVRWPTAGAIGVDIPVMLDPPFELCSPDAVVSVDFFDELGFLFRGDELGNIREAGNCYRHRCDVGLIRVAIGLLGDDRLAAFVGAASLVVFHSLTCVNSARLRYAGVRMDWKEDTLP